MDLQLLLKKDVGISLPSIVKLVHRILSLCEAGSSISIGVANRLSIERAYDELLTARTGSFRVRSHLQIVAEQRVERAAMYKLLLVVPFYWLSPAAKLRSRSTSCNAVKR